MQIASASRKGWCVPTTALLTSNNSGKSESKPHEQRDGAKAKCFLVQANDKGRHVTACYSFVSKVQWLKLECSLSAGGGGGHRRGCRNCTRVWQLWNKLELKLRFQTASNKAPPRIPLFVFVRFVLKHDSLCVLFRVDEVQGVKVGYLWNSHLWSQQPFTFTFTPKWESPNYLTCMFLEFG